MGVFGSIIKYILIVLVVLFAIATLFALVLYIFPGFYIFGYHVINSNGTKVQIEYFVDGSEFSQTDPTLWNEADAVRIETDGYDVLVRTAKNNEGYNSASVLSVVTSAYIGFMKGSVSNITYDSTQTSKNYINEDGKKIFYVKIKEPEKGFLSRSTTKLTFIVPENGLENKPLEIITKTGKVWLGGNSDEESQTIVTNDVSVTALTETVNLNNINCTTKLSVFKENGYILSSDQQEFLCDMNLSISKLSGYIELHKFGNALNRANKLTIQTENCHTVLGDVFGALKVVSKKGILDAENLFEYADLEVYETKTRIANLKNGLQLEGTSANVECKVVEGNIMAKMTSGSCIFEKTLGTVEWESANGPITLLEPSNTLKLSTNVGNIKIDCKNNTPIEINITSNGGDINFSNASGVVRVNKLNDNPSSRCNIYGSFASTINPDLSILNTGSGNVSIVIPQNENLLLKWTTTGQVDINMITWQSTAKTTVNEQTNQQWVKAFNGLYDDDDIFSKSRISVSSTGKIVMKPIKVA